MEDVKKQRIIESLREIINESIDRTASGYANEIKTLVDACAVLENLDDDFFDSVFELEKYIEEFGKEAGVEYYRKGLTLREAHEDEYLQLKKAKETMMEGQSRMKKVIVHLDVNQPIGQVHPDGMVILSGDAPVWKYCVESHKAIMQGAAVVAIAHGIDTATNSDTSTVVYSMDPGYKIGITIDENEKQQTKI